MFKELLMKRVLFFCLLVGFVMSFTSRLFSPTWGFFGHQRINHLAVFTLPQEAIAGFKDNIVFLTEHAIDPDKRRYASDSEAPRHFIDLDEYPNEPPRKWADALMCHTQLGMITSGNDTIWLSESDAILRGKNLGWVGRGVRKLTGNDTMWITASTIRTMYFSYVLPVFYEGSWTFPADSMRQKLLAEGIECPEIQQVFGADGISKHGILPYNLMQSKYRLTEAFRKHDLRGILRNCADIGHYIGDAHVPLHTTSNYNGQKTGQTGIHAFWESRLPELFADEQYDYFVGTAQYISDTDDFFWNIIAESHALVDSVLLIEKDLSSTFPADQQYTFEQRGTQASQTQSRAYSEAYQTRMNGMVETRLRAATLAVGSIWYTCWIDAGRPAWPKDFSMPLAQEVEEEKQVEKRFQLGKILGREHDN